MYVWVQAYPLCVSGRQRTTFGGVRSLLSRWILGDQTHSITTLLALKLLFLGFSVDCNAQSWTSSLSFFFVLLLFFFFKVRAMWEWKVWVWKDRAVAPWSVTISWWPRDILHPSKPIKPPWVNPKLIYGLWVIKMCWRRLININKHTTMTGHW